MMHLSLAFATSLVLPLSALAGMMRGDATPSLTLHLFAPRTVQKADDFVVSATVVNTGSRDVTLLKHGMMRQKLDNFAVVDASGTPIKFTGIKVKYSPERAAQKGTTSVVLAPGANVTVAHPLASTYDLSALSRDGSNTLMPSTFGRTFYAVDKDTKGVTRVEASVVNEQTTFKVTPDADLTVSKTKAGLTARSLKQGCSLEQHSEIDLVIPLAQGYVTTAYTYINALAHGLVDPSYYVTWFGEQDMNRQQEVAATLDNMVTNDFLTFTYNCGVFAPDCGAGDVAYVDPQVYAVINLCDEFFATPHVGYDSQASTFVHEISHYDVNGATRDIVYGPQESIKLAQTYPYDAIVNACNYEYFSVTTAEV